MSNVSYAVKVDIARQLIVKHDILTWDEVDSLKDDMILSISNQLTEILDLKIIS